MGLGILDWLLWQKKALDGTFGQIFGGSTTSEDYARDQYDLDKEARRRKISPPKTTISQKVLEDLANRGDQYSPGGQSWTMADFDRQQAIRQDYENKVNPPIPNTRDLLFQQLLNGLNAGQPQVQSIEDIRKQASSVVNPQFNPQIEAIKQLMSGARNDAKANSKDIKALYADLAGSYKEDAEWMKKELNAAKGGEDKALAALQGQIDTQYDTQAEDMSSEFAKLGIESAFPGATEGMRSDADFLNALTNTESGAQQRLYDSMLADNAGFFAKGSSIAKQYGVEAVQRLFGNLDSYLTDSRNQIAGLQGQKAGALAELVNSMQQSQANGAASFESDKWSRMAQLYQMLGTTENQSFNQQLQMLKLQQQLTGQNGNQKQPTRGFEGAVYTLEKLLGNNADRAFSAFKSFLQQTTQREGRFEGANGDMYDMTPLQAAYEARKFGEQNKLSPAEIDALIQAILAFNGKLQ